MQFRLAVTAMTCGVCLATAPQAAAAPVDDLKAAADEVYGVITTVSNAVSNGDVAGARMGCQDLAPAIESIRVVQGQLPQAAESLGNAITSFERLSSDCMALAFVSSRPHVEGMAANADAGAEHLEKAIELAEAPAPHTV